MAHWFKFWTSTREDSKLQSLTDKEFRYWVLLLCLAATNEGKVDLSDMEMVCIEVGLKPKDKDKVSAIIDTLTRRRLTIIEGDTLTFKGWEKRQSKPSDRPEAVRERVAKHRERVSNADVTRYVTPTEAEEEADAEDTPLQGRKRSDFPPCMKVKVEKDGKEKDLANHLLCDLEQFCGTWAVAHRCEIGAAIKAGCPEDCDGSRNTKCATSFFAHAKELSGQGPPFPSQLFLWRLTNGAR